MPIANLVPAEHEKRADPREVARQIREARKGTTLGKISLRELINEGRHQANRARRFRGGSVVLR